MTLGNFLFAIGASVILLIVYGVVHDVLANRDVQVPERERAEPIDLDVERHRIFPLPRRIPDGPWGDEDKAA